MENENLLRLGFFILALALLAMLEKALPKRVMKIPRKTRWTRNFSLIIIDTILVKILIPFTLAGMSIYAANNNSGLFNIISINPVVSVILSFIILDLLIYLQHVAFHHIPLLWRMHKVHHIDEEIDVTTGLRFHPLEILFSYFIKSSLILLLGAPVIAVIIFEIVLNTSSMFTHSNLNLPKKMDKYIRFIFVTPDMHRVHHSTIENETNSNFGFNFSIWDKIFRTYKEQPKDGHLKMKIGLNGYEDFKKNGLIRLIKTPLI
jgi:sterol desaturase/sphingolipid hydroxylase (fatty acid hydroxylase superfamily)